MQKLPTLPVGMEKPEGTPVEQQTNSSVVFHAHNKPRPSLKQLDWRDK
jgi:hypothetical protein